MAFPRLSGSELSPPLSLHTILPLHKSYTRLQPTNPNRILCTAFASHSTPTERRSANYMPNIWEHHHIESSTINDHPFMNDEDVRRAQQLKKNVRGLVLDDELGTVAKLELVDDMKRLGVDYHFREEIRGVMESLQSNGAVDGVLSEGVLYSTALVFRMFREHLCDISSDVFNKFRDEGGAFDHSLRDDAKGLLSLYEASFFAFDRGEEALDEARLFAMDGLKFLLLQNKIMDPVLREMVVRAMELPINWAVPRLQVRWYVGIYEKKKRMDPAMLEYSMLDFNMVQSMHRGELREASRWWKNLGLAGKLSFCRDRVVENYFCVVGSLHEPQFWYYRERMTRIFCLIAAMDDIYDIYGTLDELRIFTEAVVSWDFNAIEGLPECMKLCFIALFNTINEIAYNHLKENGLDISPFLKKTWGELCKAWLVEAEWYHHKEQATFKQYMDNAWISMGWPVVCVHGYFLITQNTTKEALHCLESCPDIVRSSSTLIRVWNDLSTSKAELERGDIPKSIQCYMHEKGVSETVAHENMTELITDTWKRLNRGRYDGVLLGEDFLKLVMDGTRILRSIYDGGDGYARPDGETKDSITSLMFETL